MKTNPLHCIYTLLVAVSIGTFPLTTHAATSASELLEKGIYAEETKGDLDAAITIYQQLVGEAKTGQSLGAQAQFRLGQCLFKKNRVSDAQAAFEKLIRDFPNEKELVARAREYLPGDLALGPISWVTGERLRLVITLATGFPIGVTEYRADLVEVDGRKIWRVGARTDAAVQSVSTVDVDAESFRPINSRWNHRLLGDVSAVYRPGEVETKRVGNDETKRVPLDKPVFDNEQTVHVMRRLPLEIGYKTTLPLFASLGGASVLAVGLEVVAKESLKTPAGEFDCFKTQLSIGQTFWFSTDAHHYLVKFEAGGAVASLVAISQQSPGQPVQIHDQATGVELITPPDWIVQKQETPKTTVFHLLDPQAEMESASLQIRPSDSLPVGARSSPRAWADSDFMANVVKELKDVKIRPESWKNHVIADRPAVSCVADYVDKERSMVRFCLYIPGPKTSEQFSFISEASKFEALRGPFEGIVASYRKK